MLNINRKRIRKSAKYLSKFQEGEHLYIGLEVNDTVMKDLQKYGYNNLTFEESFIPSPKLGKVSNFNANGKEISIKTEKKEVAYRQHYWEWKDWSDAYHSKIVDVPYYRYPRKWIEAPWIELSFVNIGEINYIVAGSQIIKGKTEDSEIVHKINLMLELFGGVQIFSEKVKGYNKPRKVIVNWDILPNGDLPWIEFKKYVEPYFESKSKGKRNIMHHRLETIAGHKPDFYAIGTNGYQGYIIFGFTDLNLYIFENAEYGNATYVFKGEWEVVSKMSKADIINNNLHEYRFIHLNDWEQRILTLIGPSNDN